MRGRRAVVVVVAVAAWVLVVAVGSTLVWAVISRAGAGVVAGEDAAGGTTMPDPVPAAPAGTAPAPQLPAPQPPAPQLPAPQPAVARRATWQGGAGVVVLECQRGTIRLVGAYANSGWSMRVDERGPARVAISFTGGEDREVTGLGARCVQGMPAYAVTGAAPHHGSGSGSGDG